MSRKVTAQRVFEHQLIWRVTPDALREATQLLFTAIQRDHPRVEHVIGIAHGGVAPARILAGRFGIGARTVRARHNTDDAIYRQATGKVSVDLGVFQRLSADKRLSGTVLLVDDICGTGATLHKVHNALRPALAADAQVISATLCVNTGAQTRPDYFVWTVSDWVSFPWERRPTTPTTDITTPAQATRHG
ncbi:phosphoribosyltransferase family protein [Actinokineospora sp. NBRC 105648]|uniref:phosphoribosyltransferase n=1 Tax=Actinokineospora sp. NBRC 105648 TaxID=3032206 RepID=UPI0024A4C8B3|nr:phosphoribosyltransferase family protein [Actinokineospora sp. NBRC 105648]GLZ37895.1 hypothetical protein Acsp05_15190 [Actinokineospora sp. NBRC 105648]